MKYIFIIAAFMVACTKEKPCGISGAYLVREIYENGIKVDSATDNHFEVTYFGNGAAGQSAIYENKQIASTRNILMECNKVFETTDSSFKLGNTINYFLYIRVNK